MPRVLPLTRESAADEGDRVGERELFGGFGATVTIFEFAGRKAAIAHHHAMRDADELGVRELDAGSLVAIVEQYVVTQGDEFVVKAF
jgi:hypothetical protein